MYFGEIGELNNATAVRDEFIEKAVVQAQPESKLSPPMLKIAATQEMVRLYDAYAALANKGNAGKSLIENDQSICF